MFSYSSDCNIKGILRNFWFIKVQIRSIRRKYCTHYEINMLCLFKTVQLNGQLRQSCHIFIILFSCFCVMMPSKENCHHGPFSLVWSSVKTNLGVCLTKRKHHRWHNYIPQFLGPITRSYVILYWICPWSHIQRVKLTYKWKIIHPWWLSGLSRP